MKDAPRRVAFLDLLIIIVLMDLANRWTRRRQLGPVRLSPATIALDLGPKLSASYDPPRQNHSAERITARAFLHNQGHFRHSSEVRLMSVGHLTADMAARVADCRDAPPIDQVQRSKKTFHVRPPAADVRGALNRLDARMILATRDTWLSCSKPCAPSGRHGQFR